MNSRQNDEIPPLPDNFRSTIAEFTTDLSTTFPEFAYLWTRWSMIETSDAEFQQLFVHCLTVFPERFFDILNQNADIFDVNGSVNTVFLPNVEFKMLYHCRGISEKTRQTLWKYLQLILFMLIGSVKDKMDFGDALNIFEGLGEEDLQDKLKTTISSIGDFFQNTKGTGADEDAGADEEEDTNAKKMFDDMFASMNQESSGGGGAGADGGDSTSGSTNLPKPENLHDHLKKLFDGKIGKLAKEIAEDISDDLAETFGEDLNDVKSTQDVFAKLMKNPDKISGLVKTVGEKLNQKMSAGDISKEDIMREASEMMKGMGGAGGMGQFADMFKSMAKGMGVNIPKGAKMDMNALSQMEHKMTAKDKMKARAEQKKQRAAVEKAVEAAKLAKQHEDYQRLLASNANLLSTDDPTNFIYRPTGESERQEKSSITPPTTKLSAGQKKRQKLRQKKESVTNVESVV